jgi:hypothetical protein
MSIVIDGTMGESRVTIAKRERPGLVTSTRASLKAEGTLIFGGQDLGDDLEPLCGVDEYDYEVVVPASEIGRVALLLLKEKFDGDLEAVEKFKKFCDANEIGTNSIRACSGTYLGVML